MAKNKSKMYMTNIVSDFLVLKFVNIQTREGRVVSSIDVICKVSFGNQVKVNIGGAARGCSSLASCVGSQGEYVGNFSTFFRDADLYFFELIRVIYALEHA